jgi:Ca-activated chloride channel family protein
VARRWFPLLLAILATAAPAVGGDETPPRRLIVMIDASASMATRTGDGAHRFGAVRESLQVLAAMADPDPATLSIEYWAFGARTDLTDPDACSDVAPLAGIAALDAIEPRGAAPLATALETLAESAGPFTEHDLVVLITDGLDSCGGDPLAASRAFRTSDDDQRLQILGVSSLTDATATFLGMGVTRRPTSTAELIRDLLWMTEGFAGLNTAPQPVAVDITGPVGGATTVTLNGAQLIEPLVVQPGGTDAGRTGPEAPPGPYTLTLDRGDDPEVLVFRARHERGGRITVELPDAPPPSLEAQVLTADGVDPPRLQVSWTGLVEESAAIRVYPARAPGGSWLSAVAVSGPDGDTLLPHPDRFGPHTVHLVAVREFYDLVLASVEVPVPGRVVELQVPETYEPGSPLPVSWLDSGQPGDVITVVPADAEDETIATWRLASEPPPVDFTTPEGGCALEVRVLSAESRRIIARAPVEAVRPRAALLTPGEVTAGDEFTIHWWGPDEADDILTLTQAEGAPTSYLSWRNATESSPVRFQAPETGGDYEVRYLSQGAEILASSPITIRVPSITLEVRDRAAAGSRIQVAWTGPSSADALIAIAPAGSPASRMFDFVSVNVGSPASLSAPFDPGQWVVRYLQTDPLRVVAESPIRIVE